MKRFFGESNTLWPSFRNRLHIYVLPEPALVSALMERQVALHGVGYCSTQPPEFLHATVQQFGLSRDEVASEQLDRFVAKLQDLAARTAPFAVQLDEPVAEDFALGSSCAGTAGWTRMLEGVRTAAKESISAGVPLPDAPARPHISLGYGLADGSTEAVQQAVDAVAGEPLPALAISELVLLAVHQDPEHGHFTWDELTRVPLAG